MNFEVSMRLDTTDASSVLAFIEADPALESLDAYPAKRRVPGQPMLDIYVVSAWFSDGERAKINYDFVVDYMITNAVFGRVDWHECMNGTGNGMCVYSEVFTWTAEGAGN